MSSYQSVSSLHQKLGDILALFSRAGISVVESRIYPGFVDLVISSPIESKVFEKLYRDLLREYGLLAFQLKGVSPIVRITEYRPTTSGLTRYKWILAIITVITVFFTGLGLSEGLESVQDIYGTLYLGKYATALLFTALFLTVLLSHELGHVYVNRRSGILCEGPILIPAPPIQLGFIGTFGAVILTKTPPCSRRDLAKMGISGPLAGFIAGTIVGIIGVYLSPVVPHEAVEALTERGFEPIPATSIALELLLRLRSASGVVVMHPLLFIAYVIYMVTFLNLLPIGQLDGGHVLRSFISARTHQAIGLIAPIILLVLGGILLATTGTGFLYLGLGVLTTILRLTIGKNPHPGVANQYDKSRCPVCLLIYALLLVLTTPIPLL
jgi:Zn-dependent protease